MNTALDTDGVLLRPDNLIALRQIAMSTKLEPVLAALPGGFATRRKGTGQEVADVREYAAGDDIRHLDRGTTARTGKLHVRQFQEERDRVALLVADFRPCMFWGITRAFRSVAAAEALALIGWRLVEEGGRVGLLAITGANTVIVPPRGRVRGMLDVIGAMVRAHGDGLAQVTSMEEEPALDQALTRINRLCPSGAEVIIASGFDAEGPGLTDRLDEISRRRTPRLVMISDARKLPKGRYPISLGAGRRARVVLSSGGLGQEVRDEVAGRPVLHLDAGDEVEVLARRIAAAYPAGPSQ